MKDQTTIDNKRIVVINKAGKCFPSCTVCDEEFICVSGLVKHLTKHRKSEIIDAVKSRRVCYN